MVRESNLIVCSDRFCSHFCSVASFDRYALRLSSFSCRVKNKVDIQGGITAANVHKTSLVLSMANSIQSLVLMPFGLI